MEFFERAHVAKEKQAKKDKSGEAMKKQLKQMLYGYKNSDNDIIQKHADVNCDLDDSSSVSGFSDLNLTMSSNDLESNQNSSMQPSLTDLNLSSVSNSDDAKGVNSNSDEESLSLNDVSITADVDAENSSLDVSYDTSTSNTFDESSNSSITSETDYSDSFDTDGTLASKILEKLKLNDKKKTKRKLACDTHTGTDVKTDVQVKNIKTKKNKVQLIKDHENYISSSDSDKIEFLCDERDYMTPECVENEEPFVSIAAEGVPLQKFSDVIGDYKYSTTTDLPYSSENINCHDTDIFLTEDINNAAINIHEESLPADDENSLNINLTENSMIEDLNVTNTTDFDTYNESFDDLPNDNDQLSSDSIEESLATPVKIYYLKNSCIFVLKHPCTLYIHGKVKLKALGGTMEINGYTLKEEQCDVYAPNYNYAQSLRTVENNNTYYGLFGKLTSSGLSVADAEEIVTTLEDKDGIIQLSVLKNSKMEFVESNFTAVDLFGLNKYIDNILKTASELLECSLYLTKPAKCFEISSSWNQTLKYGLCERSRGIVCGGKGTGKSTFLRYYVNKLLSNGPVLLIDLDPGQAEFTVAGNISAKVVTQPLLGPSFTHLSQPEIMLNLGMINTMDNTRRYAAAVSALITHCSTHDQLQNMPWIVNTMGMCNIMGLKFITYIIQHTKPNFVLQIDSKNPKKKFDHQLYSTTVNNLIQSYSQDYIYKNVIIEPLEYALITSHHTENISSNLSLPPRDERYLNFLAYFGELNARSGGLLQIVPYEVNISHLNIAFNVKINEDSIQRVINGKVVALCQHTTDNSGKMFNLADKPLQCYGHGLIRGIDWEKGLLYIITPTPGSVLALVNTLVYADWVPELRGQEKHLPDGMSVPYRTASLYQQRRLMFAPRRRFNPLQLLKMSRNT